MYILFMVLDNSTHLNEVLEAWSEVGVGGVTIFESTGINRVLTRRQPNAAFMGFARLLADERVGHNTIFTIIEELALAEKVVAATERVVGSLDSPDTGIIFALPVAQVWGMRGGE